MRPAYLLCGLLLSWCATATAATFTADVDRKVLYSNEHLVLTLALQDSETRLRAGGVSPNIDLTLLAEDFELGTPRADFRFNIDRNRGRATSSITVRLFPRRSGPLTIPAFELDSMTTAPIGIEVHALPEDAREEVFARSGIVNQQLYPYQQTLVWLDLYHRVDLESARLGGLLEARPPDIELHMLPQTRRTETVDGLEYQVTRTAWALSPLSETARTVYLPDIWIETREGRQWRLPFGEQTIEVDGLPTSVAPGTLIGRPSLTLGEPESARVGEVTSWEVTLRGTTAMNALPAELPFGTHDAALKIYMDAPQRSLEIGPDGEVESLAVYRGTILPLSAGTFALPAIELPWFNPESGRIETLTQPGPTLRVGAAPVEEALAGTVGTIAENDTVDDGPIDEPVRRWQIASLVLALLWLSTTGLWWRQRRKGASTPRPGHARPVAPASSRVSHDARDRLLAAFGTRTLESGLTAFEQRFGVDETLRSTVRAVQRECYYPDHDATRSADDLVARPGDPAALPDDLAERVDQAIGILRQQPLPNLDNERDEEPDPWSPAAFAPNRRR